MDYSNARIQELLSMNYSVDGPHINSGFINVTEQHFLTCKTFIGNWYYFHSILRIITVILGQNNC